MGLQVLLGALQVCWKAVPTTHTPDPGAPLQAGRDAGRFATVAAGVGLAALGSKHPVGVAVALELWAIDSAVSWSR